jgi:branched-chain amino acid transport system permease protein
VAKAFLPTDPIRLFGATVLPHSLLLWGGTALMFLAGWLLFDRTLLGKSLRACSESTTAAALVGINPARTYMVAFGLAAFFGGVGIYGLIGAIVGRWRYLPAAAGSVLIGLVASYTGGYVSSTWQTSVVYAALIAALLTARQKRAGTQTVLGRMRSRRSVMPDSNPIPTV